MQPAFIEQQLNFECYNIRKKCAVGTYSLLPAYRFSVRPSPFLFLHSLTKPKMLPHVTHSKLAGPSAIYTAFITWFPLFSPPAASTSSTLPPDLCISEQSAQDEGRSWADAHCKPPLPIARLDCSRGEKRKPTLFAI